MVSVSTVVVFIVTVSVPPRGTGLERWAWRANVTSLGPMLALAVWALLVAVYLFCSSQRHRARQQQDGTHQQGRQQPEVVVQLEASATEAGGQRGHEGGGDAV